MPNSNLLRILLVDSDTSFLEVSKQLLLINKQFAVETVSSAYEALRKLASASFDVVVSAYYMPGKDGLELLEELRKSGNNVPFVMFTGKSREEIAVKALNLGANYYLYKHGKPEVVYGELVHAINSVARAAKAECALRESEEKFRVYIESSPVAIFVLGSQEKYEYVNEAASKLLGYSVSELQEMPILQIVFEEDASSAPQILSIVNEKGIFRQEVRIRAKSGATVFVDLNVVKLPDGKLIAFCEDITERKKAEAKLLNLNRSLRALSKVNQALIHATDYQAFAQEVCKIIAQDCGYVLAWIGIAEHDKNKTVRPIAYEGFDKDYIDSLKVTWANRERGKGPTGRAIRTGKASVCKNILTDPKMELWRRQAVKRGYVSSIALPVGSEGEVVGVLNIYSKEPDPFSDEEVNLLTELASDAGYGFKELRARADKERIEEMLRVRERMLSIIYATIPEVLYLLSVEPGSHFRFISVNQSFLDATGLQENQVVGRDIHEVIPEPSLTLVLKRYRQAIRENKPVSWDEVTAYPAGKKYGEVTVAPLFDSSGRCTHLVGNVHDITERKKAEEALRESEERYHKLAMATFEGIVVTQEDKILDANNQFAKIFGYELNELIGKSVLMLLPPESRELVIGYMQRGVEGPTEFLALKKDGSVFLVEGRAKPTNYRGCPARLSTIVDITERKKAEEEMQISSSLFDLATDAIIVTDFEGNLIYFNEATYKQRGYTREEMSKMSLAMLDAPESTQLFKSRVKELLEKGSAVFEVVHLRKDKSKFPVEVHSRIIDVGDKKLILGVLRDITLRKQLALKLEEAERRYHMLFNQAPIGIFLVDPETTIAVDFNDVGCRQLGYSREEFAKFRVSDYEVTKSPEEIKAHIEKMMKTGGDIFETKQRAKNGKIRDVFVTARMIELAGKKFVHLTSQDITEQKQAQQALIESEEKFSKAFRYSPTGIILTRMKDGTITEVNQSTIDITGYTREELLGHTTLDLKIWANPDERNLFVKELSAKGFVRNQEFALHRKDGTYRTVSLSADTVEIEGERHILVTFNDTTEQTEAKEALARSETRFRELAGSISDVFLAMDQHLRFTYWNSAFEKLSGISAKDALGKSLTEVFPDVAGREIEHFCRRALRTKQHQTFTTTYRFGEKDYIFDVDTYPTKDGLSAFAKDVTERYQASEALLESERQYRILVENSFDGVMLTKPDGAILAANPQACYMLGMTEEEIKNAGREGIIVTDEKLVAALKERKEKGRARAELTFKRKDGTTFAAEVSSSIFVDAEGDQKSSMIIRDITERKKAEEALKESEEKFRGIVENSSDFIMLTLPNGNISYLSPSTGNVLGRKPEELFGKNPNIFHPDDAEKVSKTLAKAVAGEKGSNFEYRIITENGETRWVSHSWTPIIEEDKVKLVVSTVRDITQHKKIEERLEKEQQDLDRIIDSSPIIIFYKDTEGKIIRANKAFAEALNIPKEEFPGKTVFDLYSADIAQSMTDDDSEVLKSGRPKLGIIEQYESASGIRWVQTDKVPIFDKNGVLTGLVGLAQDITERKRLEDKLAANEEQYHSLFSTMGEGAALHEMVYDKLGKAIDYIVLDVNPAYEAITGIKREDAIGRRASELYEEDKPAYIDIYAKVAESGEPTKFEASFQSGAKHLTISVFSPAKGKFAAVFTDTTERMKQQTRLKESEQKFGLLFAKNPEAIVLVDECMRIKEVNPAFMELFGFSPEETINAVLPDLVVPDRLKREPAELPERAKTSRAKVETVRKRKDGSELNVALSVEPIIEQETFAGFVIVYKDITELVQAKESLETALYETEVLNEKLSVVGGLTRHNVRNKLMAIAGQAYLLQKRMGANPDVTAFTDKLNTFVEQAEKLLEFSRVYEKIGMEQLRPISVADCFSGAVAMFPELQKLQVSNELDGLVVTADSLLMQVFYNLIDNSLKHGAKVTRIQAHFTQDDGKVTLVYEDDGVGIAEAAKAKLFTEVPDAAKAIAHGLFLIQKLMAVYGWTITENGKPGKGVKFTITIPRKASQQP